MAKKIKFTLEQARAICNGMQQQRMERIQGKMQSMDDSLRFKEDFILYPTQHEENEIIDQGTWE